MGPRHAPDAAKQALAAAKSGVPPGERYLPISPTVYYELKRGQFHALSYFFNEDRRDADDAPMPAAFQLPPASAPPVFRATL